MSYYKRRVLWGSAAGVVVVLGALLALGMRPPHPSLRPPSTRQTLCALPKPLTGVVVVIDPGHGGADPGATVGPLTEAALSYRTACELAACLRAAGAKVVYTVRSRRLDPVLAVAEPPLLRPADAVLAVSGEPLCLRHSPRPLWERAAAGRAVWLQHFPHDPAARRNIFFISLHYDQYCTPDVRGGLVCVDRRTHQTPALGIALAQQMVVGKAARDGDFRGVPGLSGRDLGVLNPDYNPIPERVLLELATLSNTENAAEAGSALWRTEMARRITLAVTQVHQAPGPVKYQETEMQITRS